MENVSYVGLSLQKALKVQMDVVANNVANMSTPGYKSQDVLFAEYVTTQPGDAPLSQVLDLGTYRNDMQGALKQTFNPLDVALEGDGFFAIQTADGERYTRAGNFSLNAARELVTQQGDRVAGSGGAIVIPEGENQISITAEGAVTTENGEVGRFKIVTFDNSQELQEIGGGLYATGEGQSARPTEDVRVLQGMLEGSNVQPIVEMNRMIEILRTYQSVQRMLQSDHDRQRNMISKLTKQ